MNETYLSPSYQRNVTLNCTVPRLVAADSHQGRLGKCCNLSVKLENKTRTRDYERESSKGAEGGYRTRKVEGVLSLRK